MEVFELSRAWKISMYILLGILFVVFAGMTYGCFFEPSMNRIIVVMLPFSLGFLTLVVLGFLQVEEKIIIDDYTVKKESRLVNRSLAMNDVKGYTVDKNYLTIIPHKGRGKKIRASTYMKNIQRLKAILAARFPDLVQQAAQEEYEEAVQEVGMKDVDASIKRAKIETYTLTGITVVLCVLSYLYFGWYHLAMFCCVPLSLLLLVRHKGLVLLDSNKESRLPSMFMVPLLVLVVELLRAANIHIVEYSKVWPPAIGIAVALMVMLWLCSKYLNKKKGGYKLAAVLLALTFVGNGYGLVVTANAILDKGGYEYFESVVEKKDVSRGKTTRYYLTLHPWAHQPNTERESVSRDVYDAINVNDNAGIYYFQGAFHIPWYEVNVPQ